ncbi:MAG: cadherin-like domain-containing protein, partial [Prevotellaceae bacterium]|nr:cadherin-like domain-containing protein [Prevotellaceae bacterium]
DTASFLRNLLAHNEGRNWSLGGGLSGDGYYWGHLDITNNVVFNYGGRATDGGAHEVNFVNNYYKEGNSSTRSRMLRAQHEGVGLGTQKYYYRGNVLERYRSETGYSIECDGITNQLCGYSDQWDASETRYTATVDEPFFPSYATVLTANHAFKNVISDCGASMPALDEHDLRVALEARDGTWKYKGSYTGKWGIPDHHLDVGGYENYDTITLNLDEFDTDRDGLPNWWEVEVSKTNPKGAVGDFTETNTDPDNDGMTHMERYLEFMATPNFATKANSAIAIELSQYTRGYTKSPVYSVVANGDGAVVINGNYARFTPAADFKGVTYFTFKVKDADGDEMTRKVAVRVRE